MYLLRDKYPVGVGFLLDEGAGSPDEPSQRKRLRGDADDINDAAGAQGQLSGRMRAQRRHGSIRSGAGERGGSAAHLLGPTGWRAVTFGGGALSEEAAGQCTSVLKCADVSMQLCRD